ncbi:hypothetical protein BHM03_00015116 [Ensete ventricosum]|nr:hypothetical protein BHM03_00015116 [Ensete ventricosum]
MYVNYYELQLENIGTILGLGAGLHGRVVAVERIIEVAHGGRDGSIENSNVPNPVSASRNGEGFRFALSVVAALGEESAMKEATKERRPPSRLQGTEKGFVSPYRWSPPLVRRERANGAIW